MNDRAIFLKRFPLITLPRGQGARFETVPVAGINDTLSARSSRTSPLRRDSYYYRSPDLDLQSLATSSFCLTLVDLPMFTMARCDVMGDVVLLGGIVEDSAACLRVICYRKIYMQFDGGMAISPRSLEALVCLPSSTGACINTNRFCLLTFSLESGAVKMSGPLKIVQWRAPTTTASVASPAEEEETTDARFARLVGRIIGLRHDALFLKRLDEFMKRDPVKNARTESGPSGPSTAASTSNKGTSHTWHGPATMLDAPVAPDDLPPLFGDDVME
jgi:hypothetical protein